MKLKWGDILVFIAIAIAIGAMLFLSVPNKDYDTLEAQIEKDGEVIYTIDLNSVKDQQVYEMDEGEVIIVAEQGKIRFLENDCPNQICVYTGWIDKANQISVCLPNKILIKIVGTNEEVDVVVQ